MSSPSRPPADSATADGAAADSVSHDGVSKNLGQQMVALFQRGQLAEARECGLAWLRSDPLNVQAWNSLAAVLHQLGEDGLVEALEQSLRIDANQPETLNNLGVLVGEQGDRPRAIALLRQSLQLQPNFAKAHNNLANLLCAQGDGEGAAAHYEQAVLLEPHNAEGLSNYGALLMESGELERAESLLRTAIKVAPTHGSAWLNLSALLNQRHRTQEALRASQKTLEFVNSPQALTNLGVALLASGNQEEGLQWLGRAAERDPKLAGNYLFALSQSFHATDEEVFVAHRAWGRRIETAIAPLPPPMQSRNGDRIRIGYVSPDFREHVICRYLLPVLMRHDSQKFEVYGYGEVACPDEATRAVQNHCEHWRGTVGHDDRTVAEQIRADGIDVLIDLAGHTRGNRLGVFAYRPAPVQATWMGYPNTTGLRRIDYFVSNQFLNPPELDHRYAERVWRLPRNSACHLSPSSALQPNKLPASKNGWITFGSLNRPNKVTDRTLDLWTRVLNRTQRSRLVMFFPTLTGDLADRFRQAWSARGIAAERIEIRSEASQRGYLEQYHDIDIALDVTPWTGGTTIRDACWMGVTPVAWCGPRRSARGSADVLHQLGLSDFVATSEDQYVAITSLLAANLSQLESLRHQLRERVEQRLCNAEEFVCDFEAAIVAMHQRGPVSTGDGNSS